MECLVCSKELQPRNGPEYPYMKYWMCVNEHFQVAIGDVTGKHWYQIGEDSILSGENDKILQEMVQHSAARQRERERLIFLESWNNNDRLFEPRE